jgi:hypothetical protein
VRFFVAAAALIGLALAVGLYASGPKYIVYCDPGHELTRAPMDGRRLLGDYDQRLIPFVPTPPPKNRRVCKSKYGSEWRETKLRRLGAFERIWYALVGSKDTRG